MDNWTAFLAISAAIATGAMSPGPSFVVIARTAATKGRLAGRLASIGMGLAGFLFALLVVLGLATMPAPILLALRFGGSLYLGYIGVQMIRYAGEPLDTSAGTKSLSASLLLGFTTQISNPKTIVVYASVFSALLPKHPASWLYVWLPVTVGLIELIWYITVSLGFSARVMSAWYARAKRVIDRIAGSVMLLLALRLLFSL